jgi:hypothetical protein
VSAAPIMGAAPPGAITAIALRREGCMLVRESPGSVSVRFLVLLTPCFRPIHALKEEPWKTRRPAATLIYPAGMY